MREIIPGI